MEGSKKKIKSENSLNINKTLISIEKCLTIPVGLNKYIVKFTIVRDKVKIQISLTRQTSLELFLVSEYLINIYDLEQLIFTKDLKRDELLKEIEGTFDYINIMTRSVNNQNHRTQLPSYLIFASFSTRMNDEIRFIVEKELLKEFINTDLISKERKEEIDDLEKKIENKREKIFLMRREIDNKDDEIDELKSKNDKNCDKIKEYRIRRNEILDISDNCCGINIDNAMIDITHVIRDRFDPNYEKKKYKMKNLKRKV